MLEDSIEINTTPEKFFLRLSETFNCASPKRWGKKLLYRSEVVGQ